MLIFIHTTLRTKKSQRTEVWKCANYSANKCKCDGNRNNPTIVCAISYSFIQLALFERIRRKQQSKTNVAQQRRTLRERAVSNVCSPVCCGWLVSESSSWEHVSSRWVVLGVGDPKAAHTYKHRITLTRSHVQPSLRSIFLSTCFGFYAVAAVRKNLLEANWMLDEANWMPCFLWRRASSVWLRPLQRQVQRTEFFVRHRRRDRRLIRLRLRRFQLLLLCTPYVVVVRVVVVVYFVVSTGTKRSYIRRPL